MISHEFWETQAASWFYSALNFLVSLISLLFVIKLHKNKTRPAGPYMKLPGHNIRFLLQTFTFILVCYQFAELVLTDVWNQNFSWILYLRTLSQLVTTILIQIYVYALESSNEAKGLFFVWVYDLTGLVLNLLMIGEIMPATEYLLDARYVLFLSLALVHFLGFLVGIVGAYQTRCFTDVSPCGTQLPPGVEGITHDHVHILSQITCRFFNYFLARGYKAPLQQADIGHLPKTLLPSYKALKIKTELQKSKKLVKAILKVNLWEILFQLVQSIFNILFIALCIICVYGIVEYVTTQADLEKQALEFSETGRLNAWHFLKNGYVLTFSLLICLSAWSIGINNAFYYTVSTAFKTKASLQVLIYEKVLVLPCSAFTKNFVTTGEVANLMATDVGHLEHAISRTHRVFNMIFGAVCSIAITFKMVGISAIPIPVMYLFLVLAIPPLLLQRKDRKLNKEYTDKRLQLIGEVLEGIHLLKMQAWQDIFSRRLHRVRSKELKHWAYFHILAGVGKCVLEAVPLIALWVVNLLHYYLRGENVTLAVSVAVFCTIYMFGQDVVVCSILVDEVIAAGVSFERIQNFLLLSEVDNASGNNVLSRQVVEKQWQDVLDSAASQDSNPETAELRSKSGNDQETLPLNGSTTDSTHTFYSTLVNDRFNRQGLHGQLEILGRKSSQFARMEKAGFWWDKKDQTGRLRNVSLTIPFAGQLILVMGPSGSGKSSLLAALLGEMPQTAGLADINRQGGVAYFPQRPWIVSGTVKQNIVRYQAFQQQRYEEVISASCLGGDLVNLPDADETNIGGKGLNLSGGQMARVGLARALYSDKQVYLLDDPLCALDTRVAEHVFKHAIMEMLVKAGKTVILVTSDIKLLDFAEQVFSMNDGTISKQVATASFNSKALLEELKETNSSSENEKDRRALPNVNTACIEDDRTAKAIWKAPEEERNTKSVKVRSMLGLVASIPSIVLATAILVFVAFPTCAAVADFVLVRYFYVRRSDPSLDTEADESETHRYFKIYSGLLFTAIFFQFLRPILLTMACYFASKNLYRKMLKGVLNATFYFLDTNSHGTILNRFSNDLSTVDHQLKLAIGEISDSVLLVLIAFVLLSTGSAINVAFIVPMIVCTGYIIHYCTKSTKELVRLRNLAVSPVLTQLGETVLGLTSIRAAGEEQDELLSQAKLITSISACEHYGNVIFRWLAVRIDTMCNVLVCLSASVSLFVVSRGWTGPGTVGLVLVYGMRISQQLRLISLFWLRFEQQTDAISRILHYCELPSEDLQKPNKTNRFGLRNSFRKMTYSNLNKVEMETEPVTIEALSAQETSVTFRNVSLRYHEDLPEVVRQISLTIEPGTMLGLCGQTGSGKSTLLLSLLRVMRVSNGMISIGDNDITDIPLSVLRSWITIIPQRPVLFNDTVRFNLDPEGKHEDEELCQSLRIAQLTNVVKSLDTTVSEMGENFSAGEKQLFCIARAYLRHSHILLLDEVTASVDMKTDALVQKALQEHFQHAIIIAIAHRVTSLGNYDVIAVMDQGHLVELGHPSQLLKVKSGRFKALWKAQLKNASESESDS